MTSTVDAADRRNGDERPSPLLVKNAGSGYFTAIDPATGAVRATIGDGQFPHTALFHPTIPVAYLVYVASGTVDVVDLRTLEIVQTLPTAGTKPIGNTIGPDGKYFFLGTAAAMPGTDEPGVQAFAIEDGGTLEPVGRRSLSRCTGMRTGTTGDVYVGQKRAGEVVALSADEELAVRTRYPTGRHPHDLHVLPADDLVVVNNAGESFATVIDTTERTVVCDVDTGANPHGFALAEGPLGRYGVIPARADHRVAVVDIDAIGDRDVDPTEALIDVGTPTGFVDVSPDGRFAVVDAYERPFVTMLDLEDMSVAGRVVVGGRPRHVVFGPTGRKCYVGNMVRSEVTVLDTTPLLDGRPDDVTVDHRLSDLGKQPSGIFHPGRTATPKATSTDG